MKVIINVTGNFKAEAKPLLKKYHSLPADLLKLQNELSETPRLGISLGGDVYKIRLKITSKGQGKSGGARIISLIEKTIIGYAELISEKEIIVNLISIYDKADVGNISDKELKNIIKDFRNEEK